MTHVNSHSRGTLEATGLFLMDWPIEKELLKDFHFSVLDDHLRS